MASPTQDPPSSSDSVLASALDPRTGWVVIGELSGRMLVLLRPPKQLVFPETWRTDVRMSIWPPRSDDPFLCERLQRLAVSLNGPMRADARMPGLPEVWQALRQNVEHGRLLHIAVPRTEWFVASIAAHSARPTTVKGREVTGGGQTTAAPVAPVPPASASASSSPPPTTWIEINLVGDDDRPLGKEPYRLTLPDGGVVPGRFDERGKVHRSGIDPGTCRFTLSELDQAAWETVSGGGAESVSVVGGSHTDHRIADGDSTSSVAPRYGFAPDTIWNDADNGDLSRERTHPNLLLPDDVLAIPDRRRKEITLATNQVHTFKRRGSRTLVVLQLFDGDAPRANQAWNLVAGNLSSDGTSDGDGVVELWVPPTARSGILTIGHDELKLELAFDHLHPISEPSGVRQRLENLGFGCAIPDHSDDENLMASVRSFQVRVGLDPTGEIDDQIRQKLTEIHDRRGKLPAEPAIKHKA